MSEEYLEGDVDAGERPIMRTGILLDSSGLESHLEISTTLGEEEKRLLTDLTL